MRSTSKGKLEAHLRVTHGVALLLAAVHDRDCLDDKGHIRRIVDVKVEATSANGTSDLDPLGDYETAGYLRNVYQEKDLQCVGHLETAAFEQEIAGTVRF
jgi:hypothetical protein